MSHVRFDPSKAVTFDLSRGLVHLEGAPARLLVPAGALAALLGSAGAEATRAFGRALGESIGRRAATRLSAGDGLGAASADAVLEHLGGELALAGLGSLSLERWGRALVLVVDQSPLDGAGDGLLEAVLAGAFEGAAGKPVEVLSLGRDAARARFLMTGIAGAEKVRTWLAEGISWGDALVRLHARPGSALTKEEPAKDASAEAASAEEAPATEASAKEEPAEEEPAKDASAKEESAKEGSAEKAPAEAAPAKEAPAAAAPAREVAAPAKEISAGATPAEAAPAKKPSVEEAPAAAQSGEIPLIKPPAPSKRVVAPSLDDDLDSWEAPTTAPITPPRGDA